MLCNAFQLTNKMVLFWITLVLALIGTNADGEFYVLHSPSSVTFIRTSDTYESLLKEIFCAALGLSVVQNAEWNGMYITDPFNTPEAAVEVYIDGVTSLGENAGLTSKVFPLIVDEYEPDTFKGVKLRIKQRLDFGDNKIVNIKLSDENKLNTIKNVFGNVNVMPYKAIKLIHLKQTVDEDRHFLSELGTLQAIIEKIQAGALVPDNLIDFYNFRFRTLHALSDFYGPISRQTKEAKKLLGVALQELSKAFVKAYDGSVLVTVVTTDVAHTRRSARSLKNPGHSKKWPYQWLELPLSKQKISFKPAEAKREVGGEANSAENSGTNSTTETTRRTTRTTTARTYTTNEMSLREGEGKDQEPLQSADNAAIFNILLGFGVAIFFTMFAIVYACMDMDPGRDTIIYRMTTMRTKKDL